MVKAATFVSSGRLDLNNDGEADLDIVKEFMEDNNIDNKDIFDNDDGCKRNYFEKNDWLDIKC